MFIDLFTCPFTYIREESELKVRITNNKVDMSILGLIFLDMSKLVGIYDFEYYCLIKKC